MRRGSNKPDHTIVFPLGGNHKLLADLARPPPKWHNTGARQEWFAVNRAHPTGEEKNR